MWFLSRWMAKPHDILVHATGFPASLAVFCGFKSWEMMAPYWFISFPSLMIVHRMHGSARPFAEFPPFSNPRYCGFKLREFLWK